MDEIQKAAADFPREFPPGSVSGVQPKRSVTKVGDKFILAVDKEEIYRRWTVCEDLVRKLVEKTVKRMNEGRVTDLGDYVKKLQQWLEAQEWEGWKVPWLEALWTRDRIRALVEDERGHM